MKDVLSNMLDEEIKELSRKRVLIVDDEPAILRLLKRILGRKRDLSIDTTQNSNEALCRLSKKEYDLVLVDIEMQPNGIELVHRMQAEIPPHQMPTIVFMSGTDDHQLLIKALSRNIDGFLHKPFDSNDLEKMLQTHLTPKLKESHVRFIPRYDLVKGGGFLFGQEQDLEGNLSRWYKLFGGKVESFDSSIDERAKLEVRQELNRKLKRSLPVGIVSEDRVVSHYFTGYLSEKPKQWDFSDPEKVGFLRDEKGKITKRILYLSEEEVQQKVKEGTVHRGTLEGLMDYKRLKRQAKKHPFTISPETIGYIARKTDLTIQRDGEVYIWQYHQRRHTPAQHKLSNARSYSAGRIVIKTSLLWHVLDNQSVPRRREEQEEMIEGMESKDFFNRLLKREVIDKYLIAV